MPGHWNHRVKRNRVRRKFKNGHMVDETFYTIREVYYNGRGKPDGYTKDNIAPQGSTVAELRHELTMMLNATYKPVFRYKHERAR